MVPLPAMIRYVFWHYTVALAHVWSFWWLGARYIAHQFSLRDLSRTLFVPLNRITESYQRRSLEDLAASFVVNLISRMLGFFIRIALILCGVLMLCLHALLIPVYYALWVLVPVLALLSVIYGVVLIMYGIV